MTRLTELRIMVPFANEKTNVERLTRLQSLILDYEPERWDLPLGTTYHPFVFPEAATITKLHFNILQEVGSPLSVLFFSAIDISSPATAIPQCIIMRAAYQSPAP